jgi:hypothetical protein
LIWKDTKAGNKVNGLLMAAPKRINESVAGIDNQPK